MLVTSVFPSPDYYSRRGLLDKARDIFEELALSTVSTARDFSLLFDTYSHFEESALAAKMEEDTLFSPAGDEIFRVADNCRLYTHLSLSQFTKRILHSYLWLNDAQDTDLRLARLEHLI
ncbi:Tetratricopeptide repeat (TPR)-like superfamily protein [Thalictrum thalictroides]|uniref:Tetratricopeptide repeat (TPR)-like superfamily protein n=1 Tax=Thalictrum thalictroides TaxID=46969 RepID=A0A7J6X792_THATH|nr:Tetratricopeptide repeat (TPR)-like superfamily protein [Thalictrum thalictroides]